MPVRLLSPEDIYDVYGLEWVMTADNIDEEDRQAIHFRLTEVRDAYVHACKSRIRAEAKFLGVRLRDDFTFEDLVGIVKEHLANSMMSAGPMGMGPGGLMGTILQAHQMAGTNLDDIDLGRFGMQKQEQPAEASVDPDWFMNTNKHKGRVFNDPKWAEIARAFVRVESANSIAEMIKSIDALNQLQHNSFHVLIDLQTGRMLNNYENASDDRDARKRLQEVLDIKRNSRSAVEFASSMSKEVRSMMAKYRSASLKVAT